jgi:glycosyltransferase involved in cell wall biosynthesis
LTLEQRYKLRLKNTTNLLSLEAADVAIAPTEWQRSTYPLWAQSKIAVIHDGIDLERLNHRPKARLRLAANEWHPQLDLSVGDEVLTYVARNLEPVRGFQVLMRALPDVLARRPKAHVLIVGGDDVGYGHLAPAGLSWRTHLLNELDSQIDRSRVHFLGRVPEQTYLDLLSISRTHVYWTTPFVLSWSFLEAALAGVPMLASATPPVQEFAAQMGVQTLDFFDSSGFAQAIAERLSAPPKLRQPRVVPQISVRECVAAQKALFGLT